MAKSIDHLGQRLGILGGTFDPLHLGHLAAAQAVLEALSLDSVLFIPACRPPHKDAVSVLSFDQRRLMLDMGLEPFQKFQASYLEAERLGPSYTCDTLVDLRGLLGRDRQLFFIIGLDAFLEIHTWKNSQRLPQYTDFAIIGRPPYNQKILDCYLKKVYLGYSLRQSNSPAAVWGSGKFQVVAMPPVNISSTDIRNRLAAGLAVDHLTSPEISRYIEAEGLYRP